MSGNIQSYNHTLIPGIAFSLILLLSFTFAACSDETVDHEKFINAYVDLRITEDTITTGDKNIQELKEEVLKKHGMTEEQYKTAFEYFNENPELWGQFYDKAIARVDSLKKMKK